MKQQTKHLSALLAFSLILGSIPGANASAAKKVSITKKVSVTVGKTKKIKLNNNKKKVTWTVTSGKKNITLKSKKKTGVTVVGKKKGTAKVQAKIGKKKYTCKVTIEAKVKKTPKPTKTPTPTATPTATVKPITTPAVTPANTPRPDEVLTLYYNDENAEQVGKQISNSKIPVHVIVENSVTSIGDFAFSGCSGLTSITIPDSVTRIENDAFEGCSGLTSITVADENSTYDSWNNCNAIIETNTNTLIAGCKKTTIPDSVTSIGESAFDGCSGLTSITIPDSVTSIGEFAFEGCSGLTSITWKGKTYTRVDDFFADFNLDMAN